MRGDQCGDTGVKGHCGAEGISFVFGPLPDNYEFGELGVGTGLRVSLLTGLEQRIEVRYNETLVASVPTPLFKIEASEGAPRNTEAIRGGDRGKRTEQRFSRKNGWVARGYRKER